MNSKRMYFLLLGLSVLSVIALLGGAYLIDNLLSGQAKHLADLKGQEQVLSAQQAGLAKAKREIAQYQPLEQITKSIVPQDKDQAEAVREIVNIAKNSGITLSNISFPASTLGTSTAGSAAGSTSAPAASAPSAAATKSSLSQLLPVKNIPGVYQLQITIQNNEDSVVTYNQLYSFLSQLENNRRTAVVSSLVIQPSASNRNMLTFILTLSEYIKP